MYHLVPGIFLLFSWLSRTLSAGAQEVRSLKTHFVSFSYTLVPLGLAASIAFSFGILFPNSSYVLSVISDPWNQGWNLFGTAHMVWQPFLTGIVPYLQIIVMVFALLFTLDIATKIAGQLYPKDNKRAIASLVPIVVFHLLAVSALLVLFVG